MKKVDMSVFTSQNTSHIKPEEIDFENLPRIEKKPSRNDAPPLLDIAKPDLQTNRVTKFGSNRVTELQSYRVERFDTLRRVECRLTRSQKRYLDDLEEEISLAMPDIERNNPEFQRLTKNSVIRVLIEIIRQLDLHIDASEFHNEADLLKALYSKLKEKISTP